MGVWGVDTFDSDIARDFLADSVYHWEQFIEALLAGETPGDSARCDLRLETCEACLMPTVEVLLAVAERLAPDYLPEVATAERWRAQYLDLFDREITALGTSPGFAKERRRVIEETFGRLVTLVRAGQRAIPRRTHRCTRPATRLTISWASTAPVGRVMAGFVVISRLPLPHGLHGFFRRRDPGEKS